MSKKDFIFTLAEKIINVMKPKTMAGVQQKVDLHRAALILKYYNMYTTGKEVEQADIDDFSDEVGKLGQDQQADFVNKAVTSQLIPRFEDLYSLESTNTQTQTSGKEKEKEKEKSIASVLGRQVNFSLTAKESSIPKSGDGLFINVPSVADRDKGTISETIPPGTVVALYPGLIHLKEHLKRPEYIDDLLPDDNFMLNLRIDQIVLDGRTADICPPNPYALGHKINHCGSDRVPNVIQIAYDYPEDYLNKEMFPKHLRKFIPNAYAYPSLGLQPNYFTKFEQKMVYCMRGMVLISMRHLQDGDELLVDYRLNPNSPNKPQWYTPFDLEQATQRWQED